MAPPSTGHTTAPAAFAVTGASSNNNTHDNSLPRISRDFAPPSLHDTRRPATSLSSNMDMPKKPRLDDINENGFQNPFASSNQTEPLPAHALSVDPHAVAPDANNSWDSSPVPQSPYSATQMSASGYSYGAVPNGLNRGSAPVSRPQTSDGLPSYPTHIGGGMSLPSARSLASGLPGGYPAVAGPYAQGQMIGGFPAPRYGSFDQAATRYMALGLTPSASDNELQFVSLAGPAPKKRSRRRYDEIERIYPCGYKGCDKAYGTLNHLNAHVAMQKHGPKRLPAGESLACLSTRWLHVLTLNQNSRRCVRNGVARSARRLPPTPARSTRRLPLQRPRPSRCTPCSSSTQLLPPSQPGCRQATTTLNHPRILMVGSDHQTAWPLCMARLRSTTPCPAWDLRMATTTPSLTEGRPARS